MNYSALVRQIETVTHDESLSLDERIDAVYDMRRQMPDGDGAPTADIDIIYYKCLIEMLVKENGPHLHDREILQLYVLLAETYVDKESYEPLAEVADGVLDLVRYDVTSWAAMADTMPRIIDAVGESVYSHALYELLLIYIRAAFVAGVLDASFKGRARKMLKLRILIDDEQWLDYRFDADLQSAVAGMFTSDELLKIILNPGIGRLKKDPVEYTRRWGQIYYDVERRLDDRFANAPRQRGFCFHLWAAKQELLKDEYGIDWHNPAQMNPRVKFD